MEQNNLKYVAHLPVAEANAFEGALAQIADLEPLNGFHGVEAMRESLLAAYEPFARDRLRRLAMIGASPEGEGLLRLCEANGIEVLGVCGGNVVKQGAAFFGHKVRLVSNALDWGNDVPIIIASHRIAIARDSGVEGGRGYCSCAIRTSASAVSRSIRAPHVLCELV